jgi:PiT family inorganic phosphate transporter
LFVISLVMMFKGLKNLQLDLMWYHSIGIALAVAAAGAFTAILIRKMYAGSALPPRGEEAMERIFSPLQIATACAVAFAHGANDVANAIGPMTAVFATIKAGAIATKVDGIPMWILLLGGGGIVLGLATYGYRVMSTIGTKITEMTPTRGFSAEFGAAVTILFGSKLGLPLSTTHTLVGAVIGIGFAQGSGKIDMKVVRNIVVSWIATVPIAAIIAIPIYYLLQMLG